MKTVRITLLFLLLLALGYFGFKAYTYAKAYEQSTSTIATKCNANGLAQGKLDKFTSIISFGLIKDKTKTKLDRLKKEQEKDRALSQKNLYYFMSALALLILLSFTCSTEGSSTMVLALGSLISLIFGLINPILMVTIHKEVEHLGDVILSFESKGILGSITKLFDTGEIVVASTILLFSVVIPLLKIITIIFTLLFRDYHFSHKLIAFFKHLGKWSMVDVFVVAVFLVYLTSNKGGVSHAEIQIGLYLFLAYVILSMITTLKIQKIISPSLHQHALEKP
jgi:hypothetical protein